MKPYFRAIRNYLKLSIINSSQKNIQFEKVQLFSSKMKFSFQKRSNVAFGAHTINDGIGSMYVSENAYLVIGSNVYFNNNIMISCKKKIQIGDGCLFGPNVCVFDNDHLFNSKDGVMTKHKSDEIIIGKHCWIAANVVILRGTHIGDNCVIGAGCVVQGTIPNGSVVTQNRELKIRNSVEK